MSNVWKYLIGSTQQGINTGIGLAERENAKQEQLALHEQERSERLQDYKTERDYNEGIRQKAKSEAKQAKDEETNKKHSAIAQLLSGKVTDIQPQTNIPFQQGSQVPGAVGLPKVNERPLTGDEYSKTFADAGGNVSEILAQKKAEKTSADKLKKSQDEAKVRTNLLKGINPATGKKYTYNEMLNELPNTGFTAEQQERFSKEWGAPGGLVERGFPSVNKKDETYTTTEQRWDAKNQRYVTSKTSAPMPLHEKGTNGEKVLSKAIQKKNNVTFLKMLNLQNDIKKVATGQEVLDKDGNKRTQEQITQELEDTQANYANMIKSLASDNFNNWNDQIYNVNQANVTPEAYWGKLKDAHAKGDIDEADFQNGVNYFQATYGFNPIMKYKE